MFDTPPSPSLIGLSARTLTEQDVPALRRLRDEVFANLAHPDLYVREDDEAGFIRYHLGAQGRTTGLFAPAAPGETPTELVAYAMVSLPREEAAEHLARHLGFTDQQLLDTAELTSCMVAPAWRGRGLQRSLIASRMTVARSEGKHHVVSLVSLLNHQSRHNLMANGMQVHHTGLWRGLQRQWLLRNLTTALESQDQQTLDWVRADNFGSQVARRGRTGVAEMRIGPEDAATPWIGYTRIPSQYFP